MLRWLYIQLIWLHPAPFRWRFGDDMLDDFDRSTSRAKPRYFADAVASLARQWLLRPEFRPESTPVAKDQFRVHLIDPTRASNPLPLTPEKDQFQPAPY